MFGLQNVKGSCWVNAALQGIFASPAFQNRIVDQSNTIDVCLDSVFRSKGANGLKDLFECIRTTYIPAGETVGDSHELIVHLADKLPWLDNALRFKVGNQIICKTCGTRTLREDSVIEINVTPQTKHTPILTALQDFVKPYEVEGRDCDLCKEKRTCISQTLFGTFPKMLMIHRTSIGNTMDYSSVLVMNGRNYALFAVVCFHSGHWWTYARQLPPGNAWFELNDTHVREMTPTQFPVAAAMRILLYSLIEN